MRIIPRKETVQPGEKNHVFLFTLVHNKSNLMTFLCYIFCASPLVYFTQLLGVAVPPVIVTILFTLFLADTVFQIIKKIIDMRKSKKTTSKKDKVTQALSVFGLVLQVGRLGTILRIRELFTWDEQRRPPNYIKVDIL